MGSRQRLRAFHGVCRHRGSQVVPVDPDQTAPEPCAAAAKTVTCLYTLTPDRDFVLGPLPSYPQVLLGLGAGHGFKFAPTFGRILADLVVDGTTASDVGAFAVDRPALVETSHPVSWLV